MTSRSLLTALATCLYLAATIARADVASLQSAWATAMYRMEGEQREQAMAALCDQARAEVADHPDDSPLLIWEGIILSSYAGEKGGLGALGLVKEARASLEHALTRDPTALQGSAHTSLGSLYYKVPGWPIGFGNDKRARKHLEEALKINPAGIDPNFFMGELMYEEGEYEAAREYLTTALRAPDRPGRELADAGRREEIQALLAQVEKRLF